MATDDLKVKTFLAPSVTVLSLALGALLIPAQPANAVEPRPTKVIRTGTVETNFTVSSFNVLGSSHTAPGGKHADMASGVKRIRWAVDLLEMESVDVVGMQELQMDQREEFARVASDRFGIYPNADLTRRNVQNSIAWRLDQWELVEGFSVKIPYFDGIEWDMPYVLLESRQSGARAWFANFHNPATNGAHGGNDEERQEAAMREIALANRLLEETQTSVFITGDMNEREEYYCRMAGEAPMKAANGGTVKDGVCTPPPTPMPVNWIFGAKGGGWFTNYVRDDSAAVHKITDHFVIRSDVKIRRASLTP